MQLPVTKPLDDVRGCGLASDRPVITPTLTRGGSNDSPFVESSPSRQLPSAANSDDGFNIPGHQKAAMVLFLPRCGFPNFEPCQGRLGAPAVFYQLRLPSVPLSSSSG